MMQSEAGEPGQVVTFYSYKGGTGRTMALANIACLLAARATAAGGKSVLAIDWDLEAPGLHRYFQKYVRQNDAQPGLIELFQEVQTRLAGLPPDGDEEERARMLVDGIELARYVVPAKYPSLSFLRAGRFDDTYSERVNTFPWQSFFRSVPSFFRLFAERLAREYSWVLLDSRTGLTDISGVCTMLMPEKLVVVFTPNRQSLTGIVDLVRRATEYRRGSEDLRPLVVYPLPSRIETSVLPLAQQWRLGDPAGEIEGWQQQFESVFRDVYDLDETFTLERYFDNVQLQHVAPYAYGEPLPVTEERGSDRLTLTQSYETFRGYLEQDAPWTEAETSGEESPELRKQIERLNEAVRAQQVEKLPWWGWFTEHRLAIALLLLGVQLLIGGFAFWKSRADRADRGNLVFTSALRDKSRNPNAVTALLFEQALPDLRGENRRIAMEELEQRLAQMPRQVRKLQSEGPVYQLRISPDGTHIAAGYFVRDQPNLAVWDLPSGMQRLREPTTSGAAFQNSSLVTVSRSPHEAQLRNLDGVILKRFPLSGTTVATSDDGKYLAVLERNTLQILEIDSNAASGSPLKPVLSRKYEGGDFFSSPYVSFGGELVSVATNKKIDIGNLKQRNWTTFPIPSQDGSYAWAFTSTGYFAMTAENALSVWTIIPPLGKPLARFSAKADLLAFSPAHSGSDQLAILFDDGNIGIAAPPRFIPSIPISRDRNDQPLQMVWDRNHIITAGRGWVEVFDVTQPKQPPLTFEPEGSISYYTVSGNTMAIASRNEIRIVDIGSLPSVANLSAAERRKLVCTRAGRDLTREEWTAYLNDRPYEQPCKPYL
jgi:cellulose biosynthesis protein BcsQ